MFFPSPSVWKMVKDAPNHIPENIMGYTYTSFKIHGDSVSIYPRQS